MKRKNWMPLLLILLSLAVFVGYRQYDAWKTDDRAPEISISDTQLLQISVQSPKTELLQGVKAQDRRDGDVSGKLVVERIQLLNRDGLMEVGYAVADGSGNVAKAVRKVQYTDYESPKFSLERPLVYEEHENIDIMSAVLANDVLDGDIQHRIRATAMSNESISKPGIHQVHFQVTNTLGDTSEIVIPVEVLETNTYEAELTLTDYLIYLPQGSAFQPRAYLSEFTSKGTTTSLANGLPGDFSLEIAGELPSQTAGVYPVEYRVTYTVRHATNPDYDQRFTGYSKLIVVVEG